MKIKLKKINNNARLPEKGKPGDFGYDVWAVSEEEIFPNVWMYRLGFKYEIDREKLQEQFIPTETRQANIPFWDMFDISIDVRPRSSISSTGMMLANSPGTLDEFFRGEPRAVFYHVFPDMPRYRVGDKIAQIKVGIAPKNVQFEWADEINENTERGEGGFGSTGKQ
jgi:dUTP pyrophosphatase